MRRVASRLARIVAAAAGVIPAAVVAAAVIATAVIVTAVIVSAVLVAASPGGPLYAQDAAAAGEVEIEVREGVTLLDPGKAVTSAFAAYVADGASPKDATPSAVAADLHGRIRLPFRGPGGTVLVWAPGRAPVGLRVNAPIPFQIVMTPAVAADVRVTTVSGEPVVGAEVTAEAALPLVLASDGTPPFHVMRLTTTSGGDGSARIPGLPDVPLSLAAHAEGYVAAVAYPVDPKRGATLVLGRGSRVAGTLRLLPGPVSSKGATARLGPRRAAVADDGAFVFETVPPGPWELTFDGPGFAPPAPRTIVLEDGRDRVGLEFTALRASEFRGRAIPPEGWEVAALRVLFVYPPQMVPSASSSSSSSSSSSPSAASAPREAFVLADADGKFVVPGLPPADGVAVFVSSPNFVAARVEGISLPPGDASREIEVRLVAGGALTGRVLDLDGQPVAGAAIVACQGPPPFRGREWTRSDTDPDGRFFLTGLPAGDAWVRLPGRPVGGDAVLGPFSLAAEERRDAGDLRVFAGWPLGGSVPGAPDGTIVVASRDGADLARATVTAGAFEFVGLSAGPLDLRAESGGETVGTTRASLPSARPVTVPFDPPVLLRGRIVDAQQRPVAAARLRAERLDLGGRREGEVRDPLGRFELRLARGRWRLEATSPATGEAAAIEVTLPQDAGRDVVLSLEPGASVRGEVAAAEDGRRLEGVVVRALAVGDDRSVSTVRTDASGRFVLKGVPTGIVRLRIETLDRGVHETEPRAVRESEDADVGLVELPRGVVARIDVVGAGGAPATGAEIVFECDGGTVRNVTTDPYGRAVVSGLPPGGASLRVRGEGGATLRAQRVEVPRTWQDWNLRIDLASGTRVWGRVTTGGRDEPFARVTLRMAAPVSYEVSAVADAEGLYSLPPVPRGDADIDVELAGASVGWPQAVRVEGGADQMVDVAVPDSGVSGTVEAFDGGLRVRGAWVELRAPGTTAPLAASVSDPEGVFVLRRVPPGVYDLVASARGFGAAWLRDIVVRVATDAPGVRVVLPPDGRLVLRFVDARGRPLSTAWAEARQDEPIDTAPGEYGARRVGPEVSARADVDGRVVLDGLARGRWRVAAGAPGAARKELGVIAVEEGERDLGDIPLRRGGALRLIAIEEGTAALRVPGLEVEVLDVYGLDPRRGRRADDILGGADSEWVSGPAGVVEIPGLAAGEYRVRPQGLASAEIRVRVREGQVTTAWLPVPLGPPEE